MVMRCEALASLSVARRAMIGRSILVELVSTPRGHEPVTREAGRWARRDDAPAWQKEREEVCRELCTMLVVFNEASNPSRTHTKSMPARGLF